MVKCYYCKKEFPMGKTSLGWRWTTKTGKMVVTEMKPSIGGDWDGLYCEPVRICDSCSFGGN